MARFSTDILCSKPMALRIVKARYEIEGLPCHSHYFIDYTGAKKTSMEYQKGSYVNADNINFFTMRDMERMMNYLLDKPELIKPKGVSK